MAQVFLWWIGAAVASEDLLAAVRSQAEDAFSVGVRCWHGHERPTDSFDPRRLQHSSTSILKWLLETRPRHPGKIVGLTDVDLFIPILTFVYGEAQLGGRAAVVSTARLSSEGGFRPDHALLKDRVVKETVHELGHTFGLIHCPRPTCVMARSVNLVQVDAKDPRLCHDCGIRYAELQEQGRHRDE
ncbi:MAG: peptidase M54 [Acidobacteria bacterium]|nr:MAG: peptidase M54 [Acidobacteriota bacterium]